MASEVYKYDLCWCLPTLHKQSREKNRTKAEVDEIIYWLTGYNIESLKNQINNKIDFETF